MSDDIKNIFDGIRKMGNDLGGTEPAGPGAIEMMKLLFDQLCADTAQSVPSYDVTFRCEKCRCVGFAIAPVAVCPKCGNDGTLNVDRGYEGFLPATKFYKSDLE